MINPTLDEVLKNAQTMSTEEYLNYCDSINDIQLASKNIFDDHVKNSDIITLSGFFWPHWLRLNDHSVFAFQEPGAYIEVYDLFAVNRTTNVAWGIYVTSDKFDEKNKTFLLPDSKLEAIYNATQLIMEAKEMLYTKRVMKNVMKELIQKQNV